MWRAFGSLALTFVAMGWATAASAICFFYLASFWRDTFGRAASFYAAVVALALCIFVAHKLLRLADWLLEPYRGPFDGHVYDGAPRETFYHDWRRYAADVIRSRRYALYARTRQWDKLARLEAEIAAAGRAARSSTVVPEPLHPPRTSMAGVLSPAEVVRGARRTAAATPAPAGRDPEYWRRYDG